MGAKSNLLIYLNKKGISKSDFYKKTGLSNGFLDKNENISSQNIEIIISVFGEISADWLITGRGKMLRTAAQDPTDHIPEATKMIPASAGVGIPLVSQTAVAGFGNADFAIQEADVKDYYIVPKFKYCRVDFMIEISGSSMYPKYNSGDVVACTILHERTFIQWNKCHIIATREQGILCKRLRPSEHSGCIMAISDNKSYPPFDIPETEITGIALVIGVIRLE